MAPKFDVPGWLVVALGLAGISALAGASWLSRAEVARLHPDAAIRTEAPPLASTGGSGPLLHWIGLGFTAAFALTGLRWRWRQRHRERMLIAANGVLLQSGKTHRLALDQVGDGVLVADAQDCVEMLNPAGEALTGWTLAEALGRPLGEVLGLDHGATASATNGPPGGEAGCSRTCELRARGGTVRTVSTRSLPIREAAGGVVGIVVILRDLSAERASAARQDESERRLRTLTANLPGMAYRCRSEGDGTLEFVSEGCFALTGLTPKELVDQRRMSHADLVHPADRARVQEEIQAARGGQRAFQITYRMVADGAAERWAWEQGQGVLDPQGNLTAIEGFIMDVTERRAAERALAESEQRYRILVENAGEAIFVAQDGRLTFANRMTETLLGYSRTQLYTHPFEEFIHEEDRGLVLERYARRLEGHPEPQTYAFRILTRRKEVRWADLQTVAITWQGRPATLNYASDITARKRAEAVLQETEDRYRRLFENAPMAYQALDREGRILEVNDAWLKLLGYPRAEVLGTPIYNYLTPACRERLPAPFAAFMPGGSADDAELDFQHRDGGVLSLVVQGRIACDAHGEFVQSHCMLYDLTERKRAEVALQRSEYLLERTGRVAGVGGWELDLATRLPHWTGQTRRIHEVADDYQPTLATALGFYDPAGRLALEQAFQEGIDLGKAWDLELPLTTARGRRLWVRVLGQAEFENHRAVRLSGAFQDITERKQAEAQLRLQATALEAAANSIVITDPAGRIQWANRAFTEHSGYTLEEAFGRNPRDLIRSGEHPRGYYEDLWTTILAGQVWRGTLVNRRKDGRRYTEETTITPLLNECGVITHFIAIKQDITEREQREAERNQMLHHIGEQTAQMTRIMQSAPAAVVLLAPDGGVRMANTRAEVEFAREPGILRDNQLLGLGDHTLEQLLRPPAPHLWHEVRVQERTLEAVATPVAAEPSAPTDWVLVFHDVTQAREVRRQLDRHERLSAIGQFAAGIAHDFNNIAQVIVLHVQLLKESSRLTADEREHLEAINVKAWQASAMIQQILDFSRRTALERQEVDLVALCREEAVLLRRTLPQQITITLEHDGSDCRTDADPNRLRQVLVNLAFNARDAMPAGGVLRLTLASVEVAPAAPAPLPELAPGCWVRLLVADSGTGMSPEVQEHLFEPFYTTKAPGTGTGLGLAQVHGIVAQHGGHIQVDSRPGKGTTFALYFPALPDRQPQSPAQPAVTAHSGPASTILVVEDDEAVRTVLVQILTAMGYRCAQAGDGVAALTHLQTDGEPRVDLVLSDCRMPAMDGITLFRTLRARGLNLPVILLSGLASSEELQPLLEEGLAGWLPKPLDLPRLADLLARTLARRREGAGSA